MQGVYFFQRGIIIDALEENEEDRILQEEEGKDKGGHEISAPFSCLSGPSSLPALSHHTIKIDVRTISPAIKFTVMSIELFGFFRHDVDGSTEQREGDGKGELREDGKEKENGAEYILKSKMKTIKDYHYANSYFKFCSELERNWKLTIPSNQKLRALQAWGKSLIVYSGWSHIFFAASYSRWNKILRNFLIFLRVSLGYWTDSDFFIFYAMFRAVYPESCQSGGKSTRDKDNFQRFLNAILPPRAGQENVSYLAVFSPI